ncbi:MFS transporter (plasmid) [Streptomyces sp. BI20]|uniref:MFS transporter n=1 Tax=Streptomyces sp. BI20 TaxID=3403460 RepID=UPI003C721CE0
MTLLLCLAPLLANADAGLVVLALPEIQRDLGMSLSGAHWVTNVYVLLVGGLQLLGGRLSDRVGARRLLLGSLVAFGLASALCGAAPNGPVLLVARAGQAVAAALLVPAAMCLLLTTVPVAERRRALAWWVVCGGVGSVAGVLLGGMAVSRLDWRWAFFLNVPVALLAWAAGRRWCPRCPREGSRGLPLDVAGALFLVGTLVTFVYALVGTAGHGVSGGTWALFAAAGVSGALFLRRQRTARDPLLPAVLWRDRRLAVGAAGILFVAASTGPVMFVASLYLQEVRGYGAWMAGCALLPVVGGVLVVGRVCARMLGRSGARRAALVGCALSGAGLVALTRVAPESGYATGLLPGLALLGAGLPFLWMAYETAAVAEVRASSMGAAAGVVQCAGQIGAAIGLALVVTVYGGAGSGAADPALVARGAARAFWLCAGLMGCVALTAWFGLRAGRGAESCGSAPAPGYAPSSTRPASGERPAVPSR